MLRMLEFNILSGGNVSIDLTKCKSCSTKACIRNCKSSKTRPVLVLKDGVPDLDFGFDELEKGACTECLACELDCQLYGNKAVIIELTVS
ncbi:MAG: hypothetical protein CMI58_01040 [Parcubacteria group bacterium]|nr:hypothetical protein [Parcubacteria group bacterium]